MSDPVKLKLAASSPRPRQKTCPARGLAPLGGRGRDRHAARRVAMVHDPAWLRANFAEVWREFLRARFGNAPERIAVHFGVRNQTARNWLEALHMPIGSVVWQASQRHRAEIEAAAGRVEARLKRAA